MQLKLNCEKCQQSTPQDGVAYICSYECTWCEACAQQMNYTCPNCKGELVRRPKRKK
jgi:uncharacterized protein